MIDFPRRVWIARCHSRKEEDDFFVCHPKVLNGKEVEYVQAAELTRLRTALAASQAREQAAVAAALRGAARHAATMTGDLELFNSILALTPDTSALDKLLAEAREEGITECVEAFHEEQIAIWSQEILESLAGESLLQLECYDDKITASVVVKSELVSISRILTALKGA